MTTQQTLDKLITARIGLLLKQPWFGNMATRMKLIDASDWLPTAATDGRNFYYNKKFVDELSTKECEFLFGHEVLHAVFDHCLGRKDGREPQIWNIACDYAVNDVLILEKVGDPIKKVPIIHDTKYRNWAAEAIYDDIFDNAQKISLQTLDMHLDGDGNEGDEQEGGGSGGSGDKEQGKGKGRAPSLSEEEKRQIREELKEAMISAAKASAGSVPAGVQRLIKELTEPKLNWKELIQQQIQTVIKDDYTFARPNRKTFSYGICLPGMKNQETIDICVAIDASGSVDDDMLRDFLTEVKGIMAQYDNFNLRILSFDTQIYNVKDFDAYNQDEIHEYEAAGRGGTMFECVWDYFKEEDYTPKKLIFFTDGYPCGTWGDANYCDTVFIIHGDEKIKPPFGVYAHITAEMVRA